MKDASFHDEVVETRVFLFCFQNIVQSFETIFHVLVILLK
ncbi:hypothetical protein SPAR54_1309 [Streptococcus pneumoniae GA18523]|uniref:Uncharacterized protein n=1 Tax=Streptococcus mitis SK597 TaxID=585204 RepID=E1LU12_STRMT|nr:conserved hypothetical protein [Streptococcus pneumoniae Taiwan19F-14]EFO00038.1 hypothetical protein SMSK597_1456 [Streptococcus mitis SK597]EGE88343.1 hypothetical protein SPAR5_1690 [Streptococcus pneumoniae GA04375]EHD35451.1 hypothetical protein SPAR81_1710 [Streptococcus pneumoniae GA44288]EHD37112.1 hypothetical protein SPAR90_1708 [Streptococcus pneumoniae GA47281]EHD45649.1 hypothetical protein SPAR110_1734 [Streptococcus pneumoniae GA49138]EHD51283.1 hypothetical protein SPAR128_